MQASYVSNDIAMSVSGRILPGDLLRTPWPSSDFNRPLRERDLPWQLINNVMLYYGDLLLVIAAVTRDNVVTTILLHTRSSRIINIHDTFRVPWLHRVEP